MSGNNSWSEYTAEELFTLYRSTGRLDIKQEIALRYLYVVKSIALQMRNVYIGFEQTEDIVNEGVIVLMKCIDRYEDDKNAKFETYVSKRLRGMIIDIARKQDWVPRGLRKIYNEMSEMMQNYYLAHGREPSPEEVAEALHIDVEKYHEIIGKSNLFFVLSLDKALEEAGENKQDFQMPSENDTEQPEKNFLKGELRSIIEDGIRKLNEKEQIVVSLYYIEELQMKEIAEVLQVSEPRVSQIHSAAIRKLREYIS